MEEIVI